MRAIIFRGWVNNNGEWVYGDFTHDKENRAIIRRIVAQPLFMDENGNFSGTIYACSNYEVDPDTVSQFTGLCDKNGQHIFENDILRIKSWVKGDFLNGALTREDIALVEYDSKTGGYRLKVYNKGKYKRISKFTQNHLWVYEAEVIGNKWDNKSLLENSNE